MYHNLGKLRLGLHQLLFQEHCHLMRAGITITIILEACEDLEVSFVLFFTYFFLPKRMVPLVFLHYKRLIVAYAFSCQCFHVFLNVLLEEIINY
jgi:hypothetical protein